MSLDLALSIAQSGLQATQRALALTSNNIANATTDGYTRKTLLTQSVVALDTGYGVRSGTSSRVVDTALVAQLNISRGSAAASAERNRLLSMIDTVQGGSDSGSSVGDTVAALQSAFTALQAEPSDAGLQRDALSAAQDVVTSFHSMSTAITQARQAAQDGVVDQVASINTALRRVASLNEQIRLQKASGLSTSDLEDQRDSAVATIAASFSVTVLDQSDGPIQLITPSGLMLPLDKNSDAFSTSSAIITTQSYYGTQGGITGDIPGIYLGGVDVTSKLSGGQLAADVEMRDTTLPLYQAELDLTAATLSDRLQQQGLTLFNSSDGTVPDATSAYAGSGLLGYAASMQVNAAVVATPSLLRDGTDVVAGSSTGASAFTPNTSDGPAGFTTLLDRIVTYSFGSQAQSGVNWAAPTVSGLGPAGNLTLSFSVPSTIQGLAAQVTSSVAGDIAQAASTNTSAQALLSDFTTKVSSLSGVDIDTEMTNLVLLQNAYAANARVLTTVQAMWDALLDAAR